MQRIKKFRAWDYTHRTMIKENVAVFAPSYKVSSLKGVSLAGITNGKDLTIEPLHNCEIMQFIGILDKNKTEIYEADILKTDRGNYFVKECLPFIKLQRSDYELYDNGDYYEGGNIESHEWRTFEVIGNIYENPELLDANT